MVSELLLFQKEWFFPSTVGLSLLLLTSREMCQIVIACSVLSLVTLNQRVDWRQMTVYNKVLLDYYDVTD